MVKRLIGALARRSNQHCNARSYPSGLPLKLAMKNVPLRTDMVLQRVAKNPLYLVYRCKAQIGQGSACKHLSNPDGVARVQLKLLNQVYVYQSTHTSKFVAGSRLT